MAQRAAHLYLKQVVLSKTYMLKYYRRCGLGQDINHLLPFKEDAWPSSPRLSLPKSRPFSLLFPQPAAAYCPAANFN